jgi:hypothetical protein
MNKDISLSQVSPKSGLGLDFGETFDFSFISFIIKGLSRFFGSSEAALVSGLAERRGKQK